MGPLVPDMISNELNLIIAFLIGIGFGFILEQAGFSSTKKLVGLFYGYDFTVLKVFFTAGVTAMIGVQFLSHLDLLNIDLVYINPTFLWSAIIGGAIMGLGFIIGGFCPGTSVCAAAVGKIDAMAFLAGALIGIFGFFELYPFLEVLFISDNMGAVTINEMFGISPQLFAIIMVLVAVGAFWMVTIIENRINKTKIVYTKRKVSTRAVIVALSVFMILFVAFTPGRLEALKNDIDEKISNNEVTFNEIDSDKLGYELSRHGCNCLVVDLRSPEEYKVYHVPLAINIPIDSLMNLEWKEFFRKNYRKTLFYAEDVVDAKRGYLIASHFGDFKKAVLTDPASKFNKLFLGKIVITPDMTKEEKELLKFRKRSAEFLLEKEGYMKRFNQPVKKKTKRVQGGCA